MSGGLKVLAAFCDALATGRAGLALAALAIGGVAQGLVRGLL